MSHIDFLPETFQRSRRRRQRRPIEFLVIAMTVVALAGLWLSMSGPDRALADEAERLEQGLEEVAAMRSEHNRLQQERSDLQRELMTARETYQPITATQVISRLSALSPEPIRILNIEIVAHRPSPQPIPAATDDNKRVIGNPASDKPDQPNLMKLTITGHAPSDDQLVTLIRNMDADPIFTSVALRSSRKDQTQTHIVRAFHLDVQIDLDRRFVPANTGEQR